MLVVVFHICAMRRAFNPLADFHAGSHGVDIFFVISGFVMYTAARHESVTTFYERRLVRIAPLYWLATLAAVSVHLFLTHAPISRLNLLKSLAFVPFFNPSFDNRIWPLLVPGWTLNQEMFFYLLFGLSLAIRRPLLLLPVMPALVMLGWRFSFASALWQTYTNPMLLEFAAGLAVGWAVTRFRLDRLTLLLPLGTAALLLSDLSRWPPIAYAGSASVAIVVGALGLEMAGRLPSWRWPKSLGDASYSLYLVHAPIIDLCDAGITSLPLKGAAAFVLFFALSLAASVAIGFATHKLVERPLTRWLNRAVRRWRARPGPVAAADTAAPPPRAAQVSRRR